MLGFLKQLFGYNSTAADPVLLSSRPPTTVSTNKKPSTHKLSFAEKELLTVKRTTQEDVYQLSGFPFSWNRPIEKFIAPNSHPFVYMDIAGENLAAARSELAIINACIERDKRLSPALRNLTCLPISKMTFKRSTETGYSRLLLNPVTYNGKPSKYPVALFFMSNPCSSNYHGSIFYGQDGSIQKAEIFIGHGSVFLHYGSLDGDLLLIRAENVCREIIYSREK